MCLEYTIKGNNIQGKTFYIECLFFLTIVSKLKSIDIENLMYLNQDIERCHNLVSEKKGDFTMIYGYARVSTKGQAKD